MNRDIDIQETREIERTNGESGVASRPPDEHSRAPRQFQSHAYAYVLSEAEVETMWEIGRFRTIPMDDLAQFAYRGDHKQMRQDARSLQNQGLVQKRAVWMGGHGDRLTVLVLTKKGKAFLEREGIHSNDQKIYSGFIKPAEVHHDAAIYRMYQSEGEKIERSGGRIRRLVLDYELKKNVYRPLAKARAQFPPESAEYTRRQAEIAAQNRLKVVDGKILLPDLRIEYDNAAGERTQVDLELATRHYRGSSLRAKAEAGFKMYAPQDSAGGLAPFDPELAAQIFSF